MDILYFFTIVLSVKVIGRRKDRNIKSPLGEPFGLPVMFSSFVIVIFSLIYVTLLLYCIRLIVDLQYSLLIACNEALKCVFYGCNVTEKMHITIDITIQKFEQDQFFFYIFSFTFPSIQYIFPDETECRLLFYFPSMFLSHIFKL